MSLALYTLTAAILLTLTHRFVRPLSRWSALALFAIPFAFVGFALLTGRVYGPVDLPYLAPPLNWMKEQYGLFRLHNGYLSDIYAQMIPWRKALQWSLQQGQWPLWNPFILSGDILAASGQPAAYSPFTLLALLLPVVHSLTFSAATTHLIAALGAFLLARELGCRESAALVAAAGWSLSTAIGLFVLWPLGASWAWLPWVLVAVRSLVVSRLVGCSVGPLNANRPTDQPTNRPTTLLTIALTLLLLSGHPETALHVVFLGILYGIFELRSGWSMRVIVKAVLAGAIALLLSAIYILPILEAAPQTMEHPYRNEVFAKQDRGVDTKVALTRLFVDLLPQEHARGELPPDSAAVGSIILAFAIHAVWRARTAHSWFFAGMAVFCLLAHCEWRPLARALQKLPLFDIALNERFSFGAACALSILAALGVEEFCRRGEDRAAVFTLTLMLIAITAANVRLKPNDRGWGDYTIAAEIGFLALATLVFLSRRLPAGRPLLPWAPAVLFALLVAQRVISAGGMYHSFNPAVAYPPIPILEPTRHLKEPFRITGHGNSFVPGTSAMYGLEDIRGYQAMTFMPYVETYLLFAEHQQVWFNRVDDLERPFLSFLNVRFAITWDREPPRAGWTEVARQRGSVLLENARVIERAFVPRHVRLGKSKHDTLEEMRVETDFRERAWIRADLPPHERGNGPGRVTNMQWRKLGYEFDADMQGDGWVVLSIPSWKGWRAYIDGRRVESQAANHAFLSVFVPRGVHHVRFAYWPRGFVIGRAITFAALLGLIAFIIIGRIRRRRQSISI